MVSAGKQFERQAVDTEFINNIAVRHFQPRWQSLSAFHCRVNKRPRLISVLNKLIPSHILELCFFEWV
jgi:hypothetical protein